MSNNFDVKYLDQASEFIRSIERKAAKKLLFNISKAQQVKDNTVLKKTPIKDIEKAEKLRRKYLEL